MLLSEEKSKAEAWAPPKAFVGGDPSQPAASPTSFLSSHEIPVAEPSRDRSPRGTGV